MKVQQFLEHHGIAENPFGQEDAQTDHVFKEHCLDGTHHPAWDKILGRPDNPSTSVVFGEKGSGKTALRLQVATQIEEHNRRHADRRVFVVEYDDFNPFLDSFRERLHGRRRRPERALEHWRLWDHMDAILCLGVNRLLKSIFHAKKRDETDGHTVSADQLKRLSRLQKRDLLLLAALYGHSFDEPHLKRWKALRRKLGYGNWQAAWDLALGFVVTLLTAGLALYYADELADVLNWWVVGVIVAGWLPWLLRQAKLLWKAWRVSRQIRVFDHLPNTLRRMLARLPRQELAGQPLPAKDRSDDRYELLAKLQSILHTLGFTGVIVLVDRVDEPHLVNGSPERMRDLLWPLFDNKFLKQPGFGFKLLLPAEVLYYINREQQEFYERSRLDKQNMVPSLEWSGESLYDVANDRLRACAQSPENAPTLQSLFEESLDENELIGIFSRMRVPRHLFKFLYRLLVEHCNRYTDERPKWTIDRETVQSTLAVFLRDLQAFDRGMGAG